jgi:hypothetical protein
MTNQPKSTIEYYSRPEMERRRMAIYYAALGTMRELYNELGQALLQPAAAPVAEHPKVEVVGHTTFVVETQPAEVGLNAVINPPETGHALQLTPYHNPDLQVDRLTQIRQDIDQIREAA